MLWGTDVLKLLDLNRACLFGRLELDGKRPFVVSALAKRGAMGEFLEIVDLLYDLELEDEWFLDVVNQSCL